MSNTDGFIDEVTEEVRKDKLFQQLKKWGWVGGLAVVLLVGGAAFNEYRKAGLRSEAQNFGDSLLAAIEADDQGASLSALVTENPNHVALGGHLAAADALGAGEVETALAALEKVTQEAEAPQIYRELAAFKRALALPPSTPASERLEAFDAMSGPGAAFALLAQEQKALIHVEQGDTEVALTILSDLLQGANVTPGLRQRAADLIVALGGELPAATLGFN